MGNTIIIFLPAKANPQLAWSKYDSAVLRLLLLRHLNISQSGSRYSAGVGTKDYQMIDSKVFALVVLRGRRTPDFFQSSHPFQAGL